MNEPILKQKYISNLDTIFADESIIENDNYENDPGTPNNTILIIVLPNHQVPSSSGTQNSNISSDKEDIEDVISGLKVKFFTQVKYVYNKNTKKFIIKQFVCQVKNISKGIKGRSILCSFMREYKCSKNTFIIPNIEDLWDATTENFIKKLQILKEKRGKYNFNSSLQ